MSSEVIGIELFVPYEKRTCVDWISSQAPEIVAECLSYSQIFYKQLQDVALNERAKTHVLSQIKSFQCSLDSNKHIEIKEQQIKELEHELNVLQGKILHLRTKHSSELEQIQKDMETSREQEIKRLTDRHNTELSCHHATLEQLRKQIQDDERCTKLDAELSTLREEHRNDRQTWCVQLSQLIEQKDNIIAEHQARYLAADKGSYAVTQGQIGECLVNNIHANLALGEYYDTSSEPGKGDGLWCMSVSGRQLKCLVEVKNVKTINSVHDTTKFINDVQNNAKVGRINSAMLISLNARIPGTKNIDLSMQNNCLVLRASREADDTLPVDVLVRLAFATMSTSWPLVSKQQGCKTDELLLSVNSFLENQIVRCSMLGKAILDLEKQHKMLSKSLSDFRKIRDSVFEDIEDLKTSLPVSEEKTILTAESDGNIESILSAIHEYKTSHHGKYPKAWADLDASIPLTTFMHRWPDYPFQDMISKAKSQIHKGPKRA